MTEQRIVGTEQFSQSKAKCTDSTSVYARVQANTEYFPHSQ